VEDVQPFKIPDIISIVDLIGNYLSSLYEILDLCHLGSWPFSKQTKTSIDKSEVGLLHGLLQGVMEIDQLSVEEVEKKVSPLKRAKLHTGEVYWLCPHHHP